MLSFGALIGSLGFMSAARFDNAIQEATQPIQQHLEGAGFAGAQGGAEGVRDAIITIVQKVVIPALIIVAVIIVIVGMYEVMTSEKEDDQKK